LLEVKIQFEGNVAQSNNIQNILLQEIKEKLYGKGVNTRGSIILVHDEPWFFPNNIQFTFNT
jgi:plastocyanin domain-containing protein